MSLTELTVMGLRPDNCSETAFGLALADVLRRRHPRDTAKRLASDLSASGRECTVRTAENILDGHLSSRTLTRLVRAYGLDILIEAWGALSGRTLRQFILEKAEQARHEQRTWEERERELRALEATLIPLPPLGSPDPGSSGRDGRIVPDRPRSASPASVG